MTMLHRLYFPTADFDPKAYTIDKMPIVCCANSGEIISEEAIFHAERIKSCEHIASSSAYLYNPYHKLMREHMV